jgi:hypothetical protein
MRFEDFTFGSIRIVGVTYEHDVVIESGRGDRGRITSNSEVVPDCPQIGKFNPPKSTSAISSLTRL